MARAVAVRRVYCPATSPHRAPSFFAVLPPCTHRWQPRVTARGAGRNHARLRQGGCGRPRSTAKNAQGPPGPLLPGFSFPLWACRSTTHVLRPCCLGRVAIHQPVYCCARAGLRPAGLAPHLAANLFDWWPAVAAAVRRSVTLRAPPHAFGWAAGRPSAVLFPPVRVAPIRGLALHELPATWQCNGFSHPRSTHFPPSSPPIVAL